MKNIKKNSKLLESKFKYKMKTLKKRKFQKGGLKSKLKKYIIQCSLKDKSTVICTIESKSSIDNTTTTPTGIPDILNTATNSSSIRIDIDPEGNYPSLKDLFFKLKENKKTPITEWATDEYSSLYNLFIKLKDKKKDLNDLLVLANKKISNIHLVKIN